VFTILRFDMRAPAFGPASASELYAAALDMAEWADAHGVDTLLFSEHHGVDDGYLPSPIVMAAAAAGRTRRVGIMVSALLAPLHDPIAMAEDLAVLQLASGGRLTVVAGAGYRPEESAMFGRTFEQRGDDLEANLALMLRAWAGEEVEHNGWTGRVTPVPEPPPFMMVGGSSKAAARRAATLGLGFSPADHVPDLVAHYEALCEQHGTTPFAAQPPPGGPLTLFVADDPDEAWGRLGPHLLHDTAAYAAWQPPGVRNAMYREADTVEQLRAADLFTIATPADAAVLARDAGAVLLHPLCGGIPPAWGWETLERWADEVRPALAGETAS
jgi:alkanesulfonate monooxygenase SsuD/methylene tetrahydromethanopterin reductase-like flavin-dependent oxidoreductase (luciferase family)